MKTIASAQYYREKLGLQIPVKSINITIWEEIKSDFVFPRLDLLWKDSHIENKGGVVYFVYTLIK